MSQVRQAEMLEQLGQTPDEVASALMRTEGIRGVRHTFRHLNPIVRYVQMHEDDPLPQIDVRGGTLCIVRPDSELDAEL